MHFMSIFFSKLLENTLFYIYILRMNDKFFKAVKKMRDAQKKYYRSYSQASKDEMIKSERVVDKIISEIDKTDAEEINKLQNQLF